MTPWSRRTPSASHTYEVRDSDIVFVDLMMPKVSGVQVLEQLGRQNVKSAIVLMSGNDKSLHEAEQVVKKLNLDLLGVLHKPFQLPDVSQSSKPPDPPLSMVVPGLPGDQLRRVVQ